MKEQICIFARSNIQVKNEIYRTKSELKKKDFTDN